MEADAPGALRDLGRGRARGRAPADAAHLRTQGTAVARRARAGAAAATPTTTSQLLRRIQELTNDGVSLVGVQRILALEEELAGRARARRRGSKRALDALQQEMEERVAAAHQQYRRELVPLRTAAVVLARDQRHDEEVAMALDPNKFTRKTQEALGAAQAAGRDAGQHRDRARAPAARAARPARGRRAPACSSASASTSSARAPPRRRGARPSCRSVQRRDRARRAARRRARSAARERPTRSASSSTTSTSRPSTCCSR